MTNKTIIQYPDRYVTADNVTVLLQDFNEVRSGIAGAMGQVLTVGDGCIYIGKSRPRGRQTHSSLIKACKGVLFLDLKHKVIAVNNGDGTVSLWDEEAWLLNNKPKPITSQNLDAFIRVVGGNSEVYKLPTPSELESMTSDAFIDLFDLLKNANTLMCFDVRMNINQFMCNAALELVRRLDNPPVISNDFRSHKDNWRKALEIQQKEAANNDDGDDSYWSHEIAVFDRVMGHLLAQGFEEIELPKLASES